MKRYKHAADRISLVGRERRSLASPMRTFLIGGCQEARAVHEAFVRAIRGPVVAFVID
jgi:hypothetical protein